MLDKGLISCGQYVGYNIIFAIFCNFVSERLKVLDVINDFLYLFKIQTAIRR